MESTANAHIAVPNGFSQGVMTPMAASGEVDHATLEKLVGFHLSAGAASSLCLSLHLAEAPNLTLEERRRIAETALHAVGGSVPVFVHVTTSDLEGQIALANHAAAIGAAAIVAMPPYCRALSTAQTLDHFRALARATSIPMILYHSPHTGHGIGVDAPALLWREGVPVIGVKDASFDAAYGARISTEMAALDPGFAFMPGIEYLVPIAAFGGRAAFGICGSIAPRLTNRLEVAVLAQNWDEAAALQDRISGVLQLLLGAYPASAKAAAAIMGRPLGPPRRPHAVLSAEESASLEAGLAALGILDDEPIGW